MFDEPEGRKRLNVVFKPPSDLDEKAYLVSVPVDTLFEETFSKLAIVFKVDDV